MNLTKMHFVVKRLFACTLVATTVGIAVPARAAEPDEATRPLRGAIARAAAELATQPAINRESRKGGGAAMQVQSGGVTGKVFAITSLVGGIAATYYTVRLMRRSAHEASN